MRDGTPLTGSFDEFLRTPRLHLPATVANSYGEQRSSSHEWRPQRRLERIE
jgi:hypothetical protein